MSAPLEQSLRATSILSTPMFAQSAAHALTFVRQRLSAFPKRDAGFVVKIMGCPKGQPILLFYLFSSFVVWVNLKELLGILPG